MLLPKYDYKPPAAPAKPPTQSEADGAWVSPLTSNERRLAILSEIMREHPIRPYRTEDGSEIGLDYPAQWANNNPEIFSLFCAIFWGPVLNVILSDKWDSIQVMPSKRVGTSEPIPQNGSGELGRGGRLDFFEGCKSAMGADSPAAGRGGAEGLPGSCRVGNGSDGDKGKL